MSFSGYFGGYIVTIHKKECIGPSSMMYSMSFAFYLVNGATAELLISWLQSSSVVILEPRKIKSGTVSTVSPSISHEVMGLDAMIFVF